MKYRFRIRWLAGGVFVFFWLLYQATVPREYTYDGLCYALDVDFGSISNLFHANHLFYAFLNRGLFRLFTFLGYQGRAIFLMQSLNAFASGGAVALLFWTLSKRFGWKPALLGSGFFGLSQAFWLQSADPGCYAWAALATCLLLELFLNAHSLAPFWVGVSHGTLALFHQMLALTAPAFLVRFWKRPWNAVLYLAGLALAVGVPYGMVGRFIHRGSFQEVLFWSLRPAGLLPGPVGNHVWSWRLADNVGLNWTSVVHSFAAATPWRWVNGGMHVMVAAAFVFLLGASRNVLAMRASDGRTLAALWAWVFTLGLFQFFYCPGALTYRILLLPPFIFLTVGLFPLLKNGRWLAALPALLVAMALINFKVAIEPRSRPTNDQVLTAWVHKQVGPQDFFLFTGMSDSIRNVYLAYFARDLSARSMQGYFFVHPDGDMRELTQGVEMARRRGGHFFIEAPLWDPGVQRTLESANHVPAGSLGKWLATFHPRYELAGPSGYRLVQAF